MAAEPQGQPRRHLCQLRSQVSRQIQLPSSDFHTAQGKTAAHQENNCTSGSQTRESSILASLIDHTLCPELQIKMSLLRLKESTPLEYGLLMASPSLVAL